MSLIAVKEGLHGIEFIGRTDEIGDFGYRLFVIEIIMIDGARRNRVEIAADDEGSADAVDSWRRKA